VSSKIKETFDEFWMNSLEIEVVKCLEIIEKVLTKYMA
jgi:hypothetical protein